MRKLSGLEKQPAAAGQPTLLKSPRAYVHRDVETALLDEPLNPSRETFADDALQDLIESVSVLGIILPLIVEQEGERFRVHAGHRRLVVARALNLPTVPCNVYPAGGVAGVAMQVAENDAREELNAAEQARHYGRLLASNCDGDVDKLCALVKKKREHVESRLVLLDGDARVLEALAARTISLGVAAELNRVRSDARRFMFLDAAMQGGASVRLVRDWRTQSEALDTLHTPAVDPAPLAGAAVHEQPVFVMQCILCEQGDRPQDMEVLYAHRDCRRLILDRFLSRLAEAAQEVSNGHTHA